MYSVNTESVDIYNVNRETEDAVAQSVDMYSVNIECGDV